MTAKEIAEKWVRDDEQPGNEMHISLCREELVADIQAAVNDEREACALIALRHRDVAQIQGQGNTLTAVSVAIEIVADIRARSKKKQEDNVST